MALDRQGIEKRDFPIGRRGYEPEAVDAHLARIAEEVDELRRRASSSSGRTSPASIAQAASEQVRAIVEAAETSAADIERAALDEADRIRSDAESDARSTRDEAVTQSQEHVGRVREATSSMMQRVDAMENELRTLLDGLRTGANRLTADLSLLEQGMGELYDASGRPRVEAVASTPVPAPEPPAPVAADEPAAIAEPEPELEAEPEPEEPAAVLDEPATVVERAPEPEAEPAAEPASGGGDIEGARLVALNMALNGTSRAETDRYLAENFDLSDRDALLDEVYATVEG
ncbi:MAG: DivIVA domain-containing protein [Solirubrobacterales bacterium]|nr:DivIVA domain-containing protein [Solirubrobacterales bacterium]